jgi:hypothetical protein
VGLANYSPVTITNNTGTADQFSVYVFDEVYEKGRKGSGSAMTNRARIQSTWEIGKTNSNAGSGVDFTFEWEAPKKKGGTISNPSLNHYNKNTGDWEFATNSTINRGHSYLSLKGYTGTFSPFAIGDGVTALPINIINFNAIENKQKVDLTWTSYSNNDNPFKISKSTDGVNWTIIGALNPTENNRHYWFTDINPASLNYYQLIQLDHNSKMQYSDIRVVNFKTQQPIQIFPNPSNGQINLLSFNEIEIEFQITDVTGRLIAKDKIMNNNYSIELNKGIYFISWMDETRRYTEKIIIQ